MNNCFKIESGKKYFIIGLLHCNPWNPDFQALPHLQNSLTQILDSRMDTTFSFCLKIYTLYNNLSSISNTLPHSWNLIEILSHVLSDKTKKQEFVSFWKKEKKVYK